MSGDAVQCDILECHDVAVVSVDYPTSGWDYSCHTVRMCRRDFDLKVEAATESLKRWGRLFNPDRYRLGALRAHTQLGG